MTRPTKRRLTAKQRVIHILSDCWHPKFTVRWRIATQARSWADAARRLK